MSFLCFRAKMLSMLMNRECFRWEVSGYRLTYFIQLSYIVLGDAIMPSLCTGKLGSNFNF